MTHSKWFGLFSIALLLLGYAVLEPKQPCDLTQPHCLRSIYTLPISYWPSPSIDEGVEYQEMVAFTPFPEPKNDPKFELGKKLFFEKHLSSTAKISCASCHQPDKSFTDSRTVSEGVLGRKGKRNAPALIHLSEHHAFFFWDGRAQTLEEQSLMPISDINEMNLSIEQALQNLEQQNYGGEFQAVFNEPINAKNLAEALSYYQRHLQPKQTPFDSFLRGDHLALTDQEILGLHLFRTKARCMNCHHGKFLTDGKFHNLNQALPGRRWQDFGRYHTTGQLSDLGKFKTPSLRNLTATKPWFHHGLFVNLEGVVALYNVGMLMRMSPKAPAIAYLQEPDPLIKRLNLTLEERKALTAFLKTL